MISEKGLPPDAWLGSKNKTFRYRWDVQQRDARRDGVKLTAFDSAETVSVAKNNTVPSESFSCFQNYCLPRDIACEKVLKKKRKKITKNVVEGIDVLATWLAMALDSERL